ncbi:MAG: Ku protein [Deltaproteobacteria bacterium]|nr:Ku protein [Deltaproteobacteria bacterium]
MPARSIDTATLSFGLVTIPVKIFSTSQHSEEIHFHMIHAGCGQRLKQQYVCPEHGPVEREDIGKGYEVAKGRMVELAPAELKALDAVAQEEIELAEFVPAAAVDPIYLDRTYYLAPGRGGDRAFHLFREALIDADLVGIARYAARGKQYVTMVRPYDEPKHGATLVLHQLRYRDEVKPLAELELARPPKVPAAELKLALQVIEALRRDAFDPAAYRDEVKGRVRDLIAEKVESGEEIVAPEHAPRAAAAPDLMAALKASLEGGAAAAAPATKNGKRTRVAHARHHRASSTSREHRARHR